MELRLGRRCQALWWQPSAVVALWLSGPQVASLALCYGLRKLEGCGDNHSCDLSSRMQIMGSSRMLATPDRQVMSSLVLLLCLGISF